MVKSIENKFWEVKQMTETELKRFTISLIKSKEKENEDYIRYSYYELKVKNNLTEEEIDEVLKISRNYFENKGYNVECIIKGLGEYKEIRNIFIEHIQMTF